MPDEMNAIKNLPDISFIDNKTIDQVRQEMVADYESFISEATGQTVKALPDIIQWFREEVYTFCTVAQMQAVKDEVSQPNEQLAG